MTRMYRNGAIGTLSASVGDTAPKAYMIRLGTSAGSITFNGSNNTAYYGGALISNLTVTEIGG